MLYKVISTSPTFGHFAFEPLDYLKRHDCLVELLPRGKKASEEELMGFARDYDAMIIGLDDINRQVVNAAGKLKVITKHGAGVDNIDLKAATQKGIMVNNAPGANSDAVADLTMGLFLALARDLLFADRSVKGGQWPLIIGRQVYGKTLGIVGAGEIGRKVAKRAAGFDMDVLLYDVIEDKVFAQKQGARHVALDDLLARSDYVSLHVPLTDSTRNMIAARELGLMKPEAFLVNMARGGVVDEAALYDALKAKKIRGVALDVFAREPALENPLLSLDNMIATPHMGMYTQGALNLTGMICVRDIVAALRGEAPRHVINREVLESNHGDR